MPKMNIPLKITVILTLMDIGTSRIIKIIPEWFRRDVEENEHIFTVSFIINYLS